MKHGYKDFIKGWCIDRIPLNKYNYKPTKEETIWKSIEVLIYIATICLALYLPWKVCDNRAERFNRYSTTIKINAWDVMFGDFVIPADTKEK